MRIRSSSTPGKAPGQGRWRLLAAAISGAEQTLPWQNHWREPTLQQYPCRPSALAGVPGTTHPQVSGPPPPRNPVGMASGNLPSVSRRIACQGMPRPRILASPATLLGRPGQQVDDQPDHQLLSRGSALGDEQGQRHQGLGIEPMLHPLLLQIEQEQEGPDALVAVREGMVLGCDTAIPMLRSGKTTTF